MLFPEEASDDERILCFELIRRHPKFDPEWEENLKRFKDVAEIIALRRPSPTRDQWLWLYANIGFRHPRLLPCDVCLYLVGRTELLPFFRTAPDKRLRELLARFSGVNSNKTQPFPYPQLEQALADDQPQQVLFQSIMCRVNPVEVLQRALDLQKSQTAACFLGKISPEECIQGIISALETWKDPVPILKAVNQENPDLLRHWRDPWGNSLFWYLYYQEPVQKETACWLADAEVPFETANCWGISPADLWHYYRPRSNLLGKA